MAINEYTPRIVEELRAYSLECSSTQYLGTAVATTIQGVVLGTRKLKYWAIGPSGHQNKEEENEGTNHGPISGSWSHVF